MGSIITFYSYKGGVGRTMALANIAILLARKGKRVLMVDWDLEAPGLHQYFPGSNPERGLVELLNDASDLHVSVPDYQEYLSTVPVGRNSLALLTAGRFDRQYDRRVMQFDWASFFAAGRGGPVLESLRDKWHQDFDVTLIDSRTGITDSGGVCTVQMPDILVPILVANRQSLDGTRRVVLRAQEARQSLAYDRSRLMVFPLLSRFDGRTEYQESQRWLHEFAEVFGDFYDDWLPKDVTPFQIAERTTLPYVANFSFGEELPVITERARAIPRV
jgi:hypothetical protein